MFYGVADGLMELPFHIFETTNIFPFAIWNFHLLG